MIYDFKGIKICLFCNPRAEILHLSIAWSNLEVQVSRRTVLDDINLPNSCLCEMKRCDITIFLNSKITKEEKRSDFHLNANKGVSVSA